MLWTQIDIITAGEAAEAVANLFWEMGANGVSIRDQDAPATITAYFPNDDLIGERVAKIRRLLADLEEMGLCVAPAEVALGRLEDQDWAETWKSSFPPQRIGKHWLIAPSWEKVVPEPGERLIVLDPGMAFGTGYHPTTQLVLTMLEDTMRGGESVLDLGTGSGILAIAAAKLGASSITATDRDEKAIPVAQANARMNGVVDSIHWLHGDLFKPVTGSYDLILANILAKVILPMIPQCKRYLRPGGRAILSGILHREDPLIQQSLASSGLVCHRMERLDEWVAYCIGA